MKPTTEQQATVRRVQLVTGSTLTNPGKPSEAEGTYRIEASGIHHTELPALIVRAVNSHEALLGFVEHIADMQRKRVPSVHVWNYCIENAAGLIAKAS